MRPLVAFAGVMFIGENPRHDHMSPLSGRTAWISSVV